jgi:predicted nucleotidyltransferase
VATPEGLSALWRFGSVAREAWTPISDVDLACRASAEWQGEALARFEALLIRTCTSLISAGTERMLMEFGQANLLDQPLALGYCNAGVVLERGPSVDGFAVGDRGAFTVPGGYRLAG